MRFLKTLAWIVAAVLVTLFAARNWRDVTIDLWGNLQADVKIPVLLLLLFLIGWLPTLRVYRARLWRAHNRIATPPSRSASPRDDAEEELPA